MKNMVIVSAMENLLSIITVNVGEKYYYKSQLGIKQSSEPRQYRLEK